MPPPTLTLRQLNRATLARQGLLEPLPRGSVARQVERLGSLQAQHPDWPPFALQTRLAPSAPADLQRARRSKSVVRAPLMRMTVHVVAAGDFWPMSTVTHPFRLEQWRLLFKRDPVTSPLGRRIGHGHQAVLSAMAERPLAIHEIEAILAARMGRVPIPPNRPLWRHFSGTIPLVLVPYRDEAYGRQRYLPAVEWLGPPRDREDTDWNRAAAHLARRYLGAFGPASVEDLVAYVGRGKNLSRWRAAIRAIEDTLVAFSDEGGRPLLDLPDAPRPDPDTPAPARLLARWDSLLLAHETAHRARVLPPAHQATVITRNADVLPTFLVDGRVAGTWLPRKDRDGAPRIELRPLERLAAADREALEAEAGRLLPGLGGSAFHRYPGTD